MSADGSKPANRYIFRARDFYELLEKQHYRCPYTDRELTPTNCIAEHRVPLRKGGKHEGKNIVLVDHQVAYLKRYMTDEEVKQLVADMMKTLKQKGARK
ncbi:HNH endonuclease [Turneriella parva]|uniref:HNH endonuclease n=1 Tax=Turneriella parva TaxID=29510 RepID=UPI0005A54578|nr:HNH endonuclease signature motif containing protein [Turneriella parva]